MVALECCEAVLFSPKFGLVGGKKLGVEESVLPNHLSVFAAAEIESTDNSLPLRLMRSTYIEEILCRTFDIPGY
jgi:hypothetical protein